MGAYLGRCCFDGLASRASGHSRHGWLLELLHGSEAASDSSKLRNLAATCILWFTLAVLSLTIGYLSDLYILVAFGISFINTLAFTDAFSFSSGSDGQDLTAALRKESVAKAVQQPNLGLHHPYISTAFYSPRYAQCINAPWFPRCGIQGIGRDQDHEFKERRFAESLQSHSLLMFFLPKKSKNQYLQVLRLPRSLVCSETSDINKFEIPSVNKRLRWYKMILRDKYGWMMNGFKGLKMKLFSS